MKRDYDAAIACFRQAIELDPKDANAHFNLGQALSGKGQVEEAVACWRQAIARDPTYAKAHNNLGVALSAQGPGGRGHRLLPQGPRNRPEVRPARTNLAQAERLAVARDNLPAFQNGSYTPATNDERLGLALWCQVKKLHRTAAGLYADAFAADPKLADDLKAGTRYNAACSTALAVAGQGEDAAKLDDRERTRLRQQALDWLRADLVLRAKQLESNRAERTEDAEALATRPRPGQSS